MENRETEGYRHEGSPITTLPDPRCVVTVGGGRGFIIKQRFSTAGFERPPHIKLRPFLELRRVATAGHCLPKLPPAHAWSYQHERTYNLLGTLDGSKAGILAECLFVDPIADIAVLGCPDNQVFCDEAEAYDELTEKCAIPSDRQGRERSRLDARTRRYQLDSNDTARSPKSIRHFATDRANQARNVGISDPQRSRARSWYCGYRHWNRECRGRTSR